MQVNRRNFLFGAAGAALVGSAAGFPRAELFAQDFGQASLPPAEESGIEHIVVVMMENRTFDGGAMDGFLRSGKNDDYVIGYYVEANRPFSSAMASISSKYDDRSAGLADEM